MQTLKDKSYYEVLKSIFNSKYNSITKKYISRKCIGSCSFLYKKYSPIDYQDFFNKYISDYDVFFNRYTLSGDVHKGRSIEQLRNIAHQYYIDINDPNITEESCYDDLINHVIIETFDGHKAEHYLMDMLSKTGKYIVNDEVDDLDAVCGVDITVKDKTTGKIVSFLQVKPHTTFVGNNNPSLMKDRENFYHKQEKLNSYLITNGRSDEIKNIEYICYDRNAFNRGEFKFLTINGKRRLQLNELCERNGHAKINVNDMIFEEIKNGE